MPRSPGITSPPAFWRFWARRPDYAAWTSASPSALQDTLDQARGEDREDYRQVKERIQELTRDLPELREILGNMVDAGIQAQRA